MKRHVDTLLIVGPKKLQFLKMYQQYQPFDVSVYWSTDINVQQIAKEIDTPFSHSTIVMLFTY